MGINLRLKLRLLSFFHLLTHAIFKSTLFICAGIIIHLINNNQDIRIYGSLNEFIPFVIIRFYIANLSLCGMPFFSGFYSKDLIIEIIYLTNLSYFIIIFIVLSLIFTVIYTFRLFYYLFFYEVKFNRSRFIKENNIINFSIILLVIFRLVSGGLLN